jgi:hypothetical protein
MATLQELAPNYRRAVDRWPSAPTLARCHEALDACFGSHNHGLVEHIKSFIECVCVTILGEFGKPIPSATPTTTELLVAALAALGLQNTRGANKLDKVLHAFNRLADALSDMRNETGPVAHGRDGFLDPVTADHGRAFLHVGDAVLGVLLNALEGKEPDLNFTREPYERFQHLHERIDKAARVTVAIEDTGDRLLVVVAVSTGPEGDPFEIRLEPSRLLFGVDRSAYIEVLKSAVVAVPEEDEEAAEVGAEEAPVVDEGRITGVRGPSPALVPTYAGALDSLRGPLNNFLQTEGWTPSEHEGGQGELTNSLLATAEGTLGLDWKQRENLQAGLKVAFRRVLSKFGIQSDRLEGIAERLVTWMKIHAPDDVTAMQPQATPPHEATV